MVGTLSVAFAMFGPETICWAALCDRAYPAHVGVHVIPVKTVYMNPLSKPPTRQAEQESSEGSFSFSFFFKYINNLYVNTRVSRASIAFWQRESHIKAGSLFLFLLLRVKKKRKKGLEKKTNPKGLKVIAKSAKSLGCFCQNIVTNGPGLTDKEELIRIKLLSTFRRGWCC